MNESLPRPPELSGRPLRMLLVEDSQDDAELILSELAARPLPIESERVQTAAAMSEALAAGSWDFVLSDYNLPQFSAMEALELLRSSGHEQVPFIIISGYVGEEAAVDLMKSGAADFVMKSNLGRLVPAIQRSLREADIARSHVAASAALQESESLFKAIASNIPGIVFQCSWSSLTGVRIEYVSDRCQEVLGRRAEDIIGNPAAIIEMIVPENRFSFQRSWLGALRGCQIQNWEGRVTMPDGLETKWINVRASVRAHGADRLIVEGIATNITRNKLAELEILRSHEELRELSTHLERVKEEERAHLARELHDELGSLLTAAKIDLAALNGALDPQRTDMSAKAASIESLLDQAMEISQRIARSLRPGVLDHGIVAAIEWQAKQFEKRLGIPCHFDCARDDITIGPEPATAVFRIFQEALTNIMRHANATEVCVHLRESKHRLELQISDNGKGITRSKEAMRPSFGIRGMRERAESLGGNLLIGPRRNGGTEIRVSIPRRTARVGRTRSISPAPMNKS